MTEIVSSFTNHLAGEKSPYLVQHAHNPVDWHPWGEEAFSRARTEQKPIFLSIGYSTCHWCHVMAQESFESEGVAGLLNANFISIKVDREERPDVDRVYMTFVQATTGGGGWPMSVFLTPDLEPFAGGTYFPPSDRYGRPGFPTLLKRITEVWKSDRERLLRQGKQIIDALRGREEGTPSASEMDARLLRAGYDQIAAGFDPDLGGFGDAPKFPRPVIFDFLFRVYAASPKSSAGIHALEMSLLTLRKMAEGGMHDHLGGGFHRYSVDRYWHIPHFEKMLYDQAQLACSYLDAFQITRDPSCEGVARDILDYVRRDMTSPEGGFFSAEDADSLFAHGNPAHGEGAFYVWTQEEIVRILGKESAAVFNYVHGVEAEGNARPESDPHREFTGKNTLFLRHTVAEAAAHFSAKEEHVANMLADSRQKLFDVRATRPHPHLDDKIITAWNGLMISAFARAAVVLNDSVYLRAAINAASFLKENLANGDTLLRSYCHGPGHVEGFADDYASLIQGLLDLYEASFEIRWLQWAVRLQEKQDELFLDPQNGGYFSVTGGDPSILVRMKEDYDGAEPSPNSISALNLLRLSRMTGRTGFEEQAAGTMRAFGGQLERMPMALPRMLAAFDFALSKPLQIMVAGDPADAATRALLDTARHEYLPNKVLLLADGGAGQKWLAERLEVMRDARPLNGIPAAYVCENFTCRLPVSDSAELALLIRRE